MSEFIVAITGGVASGKSTVDALFRTRGVVVADADMFPPSHAVEAFELLGGGQRDGGWMGEGRPAGGHALAILPGLTHYTICSSPLLAEAAISFLDG